MNPFSLPDIQLFDDSTRETIDGILRSEEIREEMTEQIIGDFHEKYEKNEREKESLQIQKESLAVQKLNIRLAILLVIFGSVLTLFLQQILKVLGVL